MKSEKRLTGIAVLLLATLYMAGCEGALIQQGYKKVTAPQCSTIHEIQGIERAWVTSDQSVEMCIVGIPVGRVADKPPARSLWKEKKYSVTLPADILHPPSWIAEAGPDDVVDIPAAHITPGCTEPTLGSQEVPIVRWGGTETSEPSPEPAHLAIIDSYNRSFNAEEYQPDSGNDQVVVLRRTIDGGSLLTYRHYRLQRTHGEPPPDMVGFAVFAVLADSVALAFGGDGLLRGEGESEPMSCLRD